MNNNRLNHILSFVHRIIHSLKEWLHRCSMAIAFATWQEFPLFITMGLLWGLEVIRDNEGMLRWDRDGTLFIYTGRIAMVMTLTIAVCWFVHRSKKKNVLRSIAYVFVLLPIILFTAIRQIAGINICETSLQLILETTVEEATSFFKLYVLQQNSLIYSIYILLGISVLVVWEHYWHKQGSRLMPIWWNSFGRWLISGTGLVGTLFYLVYISLLGFAIVSNNPSRWQWYGKAPMPQDPISKLTFSCYALRGMRAEIDRVAQESENYAQHNTATTDCDTLHVVFVVGESYIRSHAAIYGYPLPTTPTISHEIEQGQLYAFEDAVSPAPLTFQAMQEIFFTRDVATTPWHNGVFFPMVFRMAGFHVSYFDNQVVMATDSDRPTTTYRTLNPMFHPLIANLSYDYLSSKSYDYDEDLVRAFISQSSSIDKPLQFSILHLKGQHFDAARMYPHEARFERFKIADYNFRKETWLTNEHKQHIADYDNATLYNDYVLSLLFEHYRDSSAVIVYLSDHGEEVYDFRKQWGRLQQMGDAQQTTYYHRVPLMVWLSPSYIQTFPERATQVREALHQPFLTANVSQLLFSLASLHSTCYTPTSDILNPNYHSTPRYLIDGRNFDEVVSTR